MRYQIPNASFERIQRAYTQLDQITAIVAEALGVDISQSYRLDLANRQFVVSDAESEAPNGLAAPLAAARSDDAD